MDHPESQMNTSNGVKDLLEIDHAEPFSDWKLKMRKMGWGSF